MGKHLSGFMKTQLQPLLIALRRDGATRPTTPQTRAASTRAAKRRKKRAFAIDALRGGASDARATGRRDRRRDWIGDAIERTTRDGDASARERRGNGARDAGERLEIARTRRWGGRDDARRREKGEGRDGGARGGDEVGGFERGGDFSAASG